MTKLGAATWQEAQKGKTNTKAPYQTKHKLQPTNKFYPALFPYLL
jgi:hypothetical protein